MDHSIIVICFQRLRMCQSVSTFSLFLSIKLFLGFSSLFLLLKICISSKHALWLIISKKNIPRLYFTHFNVLSKHLYIRQGLLTKPISNIDAWTTVLLTCFLMTCILPHYWHMSEMEAFHRHRVVCSDQWNNLKGCKIVYW